MKGRGVRPPVPPEDFYDQTGGFWTQEIKPPDPRRRLDPLSRVGYWSNFWVHTDMLDANEEERSGYDGHNEDIVLQ